VRSCMRNLFIGVGGQGWGGSANPCRVLVAGVGGYFDRKSNLYFLCFSRGLECMMACGCMYT